MAREAPSVVGARTELAVATGLVRAGYDVLTPFFNAHSRVDLVAIGDTGLLKLQVKTSQLGDGFLRFATCSHTGKQQKDYRGQVDAFGVYSPELHLVYLVPVDEAPTTVCHLRIEPPRNNQSSKVRWAADYLVGPP